MVDVTDVAKVSKDLLFVWVAVRLLDDMQRLIFVLAVDTVLVVTW